MKWYPRIGGLNFANKTLRRQREKEKNKGMKLRDKEQSAKGEQKRRGKNVFGKVRKAGKGTELDNERERQRHIKEQ